MAQSDRRDEEGAGDVLGGESEAVLGGESEAERLSRLEERLERASEAAERLFAQAGGSGQAADSSPPPSGWQLPKTEPRPGTSELEALLSALASLRELVPPDLERRIADALRELLLAVRALIDWYLERAHRSSPESSEVEDIPIT